MSRTTRLIAASLACTALIGGVTPAPARPRANAPADPAAPPIPAQWPRGEAYVLPGDAALPAYGYAQVLADPRLVRVIDAALAHNQDMAVALANIAATRAQYQVQRGALFPEFDAGAGFTHAGGDGKLLSGTATKGDAASFQGTMASYEVDLFGRVQGLTAAARAQYLASEAGARATRLTLIANVANAWLTYAADQSLLKLAQDTAASAQQSVNLTRRRVDGGIAPLTDQRKAELTLHTADADIAAQTTAIAQDLNALRLLVGADIPADALPTAIDDAAAHLSPVPAGLDSAILLRRPDVVQSEFALRASDAQVDAARAALFPKITLTGVAGVATTALSSLFTGGAFGWAVGSAISYPIFRGGAGKAAYKVSQAQRDAALAGYRKAVQSAFADVANTLARRGTIETQAAEVQAARDAALDNYRLTDRRYRGGIGTWLDALTAQQSLYATEKTLVAVRLTRAGNLVGLYRALGGDQAQVAAMPPIVGTGGGKGG
jgi:multidrug efflux system outer membrane protein